MKKFGFTIWSMVILIVPPVASAGAADQPADCLIGAGSCSKSIGDRRVVFDISPKPVMTMKELTFAVRIEGGGTPQSLVLDLSMPGMYMGRNRVDLKKNSDGGYSGRGVIPRCPSGKRLWQAEIEIPGAGRVVYRFNVDH